MSSKVLGLNKADSSTIAIETGIQNSTLGIAVGTLILAETLDSGISLPPTTVPSAVYGITMYLVSVPILLFLKKRIQN